MVFGFRDETPFLLDATFRYRTELDRAKGQFSAPDVAFRGLDALRPILKGKLLLKRVKKSGKYAIFSFHALNLDRWKESQIVAIWADDFAKWEEEQLLSFFASIN